MNVCITIIMGTFVLLTILIIINEIHYRFFDNSFYGYKKQRLLEQSNKSYYKGHPYKCRFWTGVEYQGMYECTLEGSICNPYICGFWSKNPVERLRFHMEDEFRAIKECGFRSYFITSPLHLYRFNWYYKLWGINGILTKKEESYDGKKINKKKNT